MFQHRRYRGIGDEPTGGPVPIHHSHGRQRFSWIHIDDVLGAIRFLEQRDDLDGPVNLSSPNPSDNRTLMSQAPHGRHADRPPRAALALEARVMGAVIVTKDEDLARMATLGGDAPTVA